MNSKKILSPLEEIAIDDEELPEGWRWQHISDVGNDKKNAIVDGPFGSMLKVSDYIENGEYPVITITNIDQGFTDKNVRYISKEKFSDIKRSAINPGDIIMAKIGSSYGKCGFYPDYMPTGIIPANMIKISVSENVNKKFVYFFFKSRFFKDELDTIVSYTAQPAFSLQNFKKLLIPLPPLAEQQRIVAHIEALLTQVIAARDRLRRVPLIMKKFRQAVLAAACSGRLTDGPDGYVSQLAGDLFTDARYGTSNKCDYTTEGKIPVLRIPNIATGKLELTDLKYGDLTDREFQKLVVQEGDLIICRTNGSLDLIGKAAIIPNLSEQFVFASYLIRVRVNRDLLLPEYYHICLTGQIGRDHIEERARSTTGLFNLNLEILRTMPIPLPPLAEQHEIVRRVGLLFERADAFDQEVAAAGRRCERLTQAVLGKAFSGKL